MEFDWTSLKVSSKASGPSFSILLFKKGSEEVMKVKEKGESRR